MLVIYCACLISQLTFGQVNVPTPSRDYIANVQFFSFENGLSHRNVFCSYRDSLGYMWMGTKYGLNRFDGYDFKLYTKEHNKLASNEIHQIFQDSEGWLWLLTYAGIADLTTVTHLSLLNPKTGEVHDLETHFGKDIGFKREDLYHLTVNEGNKNIFLGTKTGQVFIYQKGETFKKLQVKGWQKMYPWLQTTSESIIVESSDPDVSAQYYEMTDNGKVLNSWEGFEFNIQGQDANQNVFGNFKKGINEDYYELNFAAFKPQSNPKPYELNGELENLYGKDWTCQIYYRKSDDTFWDKSESRFFVYHPEKGILFDFNIDHPDIAKNHIHDIHFDKTGIAWISTSQGFYSILLTENPFRRFLFNSSTTYDIGTFMSCRGMVRLKNTLWLGTELQRNHKVDLTTGQSEILPYFEEEYTFEGRIIIEGNENQLFFGEQKLFDYQISDGSYQIYAWEDGTNTQIWSLYKDQRERVWAGSYDGPIGYWKEGMNHIEIYKKLNGFDFPNGGFIYHFLELDKENMLISTSFGIYLLNYEKGILNRYWTGGKGDAYFPSDNVFHMIKDKEEEGLIWVATGRGGLVSFQLAVLSRNRQPSTVHRQPFFANSPSLMDFPITPFMPFMKMRLGIFGCRAIMGLFSLIKRHISQKPI